MPRKCATAIAESFPQPSFRLRLDDCIFNKIDSLLHPCDKPDDSDSPLGQLMSWNITSNDWHRLPFNSDWIVFGWYGGC